MALILQTGFKFANIVSQEQIEGFYPWFNLDNIKTDNIAEPEIYYRSATAGGGAVTQYTLNYLRFFERSIGGSITHIPNSATSFNQPTGTSTELTIGSDSDLLETDNLNVTRYNRSNFGVELVYGEDDTGNPEQTYVLRARDFNLNIPAQATVTGLEIKIKHAELMLESLTVHVEYVAVNAHFEWDAELEDIGSSSLQCYPTLEVSQTDKKVRYLVANSRNEYIGEWQDVVNDLEVRSELNNAQGSLEVVLGRSEMQGESLTDFVLTEEDENILTENDQPILAELLAVSGLGEGTTVDLNYNVDVMVYDGYFEPLFTEDNIPIYTETDNLITSPVGYPLGIPVFSGYLAEWELAFGENNNIKVLLLSHGNELQNIELGLDDEKQFANDTFSSSHTVATKQFYNSGGNWVTFLDGLAQTFTMVGNENIDVIEVFSVGPGNDQNGVLDIEIYSGSITGSPTLLSQGSTPYIATNDLQSIKVVLDNQVSLSNGNVYTIKVNSNVFIRLAGSTAYSGGTCFGYINEDWFDLENDMMFALYESFTETRIPFLSEDPSNIARTVIDYARARGARIYYDSESIQDTGTTVSYTFNINTVAEALEKIVELCPADWYWHYDVGTNLYSLKTRSESPDRYFTLQKDVVNARFRRSLLSLVNTVYFSGGGDPQLLVKTEDIPARNQWRRALKKLSDQRVLLSSTAEILSESEIDRNKQPVFFSDIEISKNHYDYLENIQLGEMVGFINFGGLIDEYELQIVGKTYKLDQINISLDKILPRISKRIQDIKRNLDNLENTNTPDSPL